MIAAFLSFLFGVYAAVATMLILFGGGDPEGRFKVRWAFLWPFYLKKLFFGGQ